MVVLVAGPCQRHAVGGNLEIRKPVNTFQIEGQDRGRGAALLDRGTEVIGNPQRAVTFCLLRCHAEAAFPGACVIVDLTIPWPKSQDVLLVLAGQRLRVGQLSEGSPVKRPVGTREVKKADAVCAAAVMVSRYCPHVGH